MTQQGPGDEVQEPENSTVDDWFGQNAARDQELADKLVAEEGSEEAAEERFEQEAQGEERYDAGHDRPGDEQAEGDAVGRPA
ncbi:MAG TPA: hypothetical protein VHK88_10735 [Aquihabitans sp.]|jgi:hypothetical protein|nr:hypothetical protein [Aquihabitans sp.]